MSHVKWPEIEGFHHIRKGVQKYGEAVGETSIAHRGSIVYKPKIKLHGTNAGVTIKNNGKDVFAQSRTAIIGTGNDNAGFAAWVEDNRDYFEPLQHSLGDVTTIFGEWCGKGIQKGVSIAQIDRKVFAVFGVQVDERVFVDPTEIANIMRGVHDDVLILPWGLEDSIAVDWTDEESMKAAVDFINPMVDAVDSSDPWVKAVFDIDGPGEGYVWYPISLTDVDGAVDRENLGRYMFKTKGEKHQVVKTKKAAQIDPEVAKSIDEFVELVVTEARLEQGAREVNRGELDFSHKLIGPFIGWISKDVNKECQAELEAAGLDWKQASKAVTTKARNWYLEKIKEF